MLAGMFAPRGASTPASYLDDLTPLPRAVHSLRKMISTATSAVRVRRSSDNAEQDIGFSGDALDTSSLATFVGANSAFAVTWYDQTGNGYNQVQATASKQPRIVNAGVYDGQLVYDGTDDSMTVASLPFGTPYVGLYLKGKIEDQVTAEVAYETSTNYNANPGAWIVYMDTDVWGVGIQQSSNFRKDFNPPNQTSLTQTTILLQTAVADGTTPQMRLWATGSLISNVGGGGTPVTPVANFGANTLYVGSRADSSLFLPIWEETKALYDADTTSIQTAIEAIVA